MVSHVRQRAKVGGLSAVAEPGGKVADGTKLGSSRFDRLDALRGLAIVWMAAFHFCFDLNYFRFIRQNFNADPFWTIQRTCIVSLFLFCAGVSQAVAVHQRQSWQRFWKRWMQLAACAVLVSAGSWFMFPNSFISFGVLHGIAAMLIVARATAGWKHWLWPLGLIAVMTPWLVQHPAFDTRWLNWTGLVTHKPVTEDYVPLLPWLGVVWWGVAAGQSMLAHQRHWLAGSVPGALRPLSVLGRWSLSFYMLHQPVLIGLLYGAHALMR